MRLNEKEGFIPKKCFETPAQGKNNYSGQLVLYASTDKMNMLCKVVMNV